MSWAFGATGPRGPRLSTYSRPSIPSRYVRLECPLRNCSTVMPRSAPATCPRSQSARAARFSSSPGRTGAVSKCTRDEPFLQQTLYLTICRATDKRRLHRARNPTHRRGTINTIRIQTLNGEQIHSRGLPTHGRRASSAESWRDRCRNGCRKCRPRNPLDGGPKVAADVRCKRQLSGIQTNKLSHKCRGPQHRG